MRFTTSLLAAVASLGLLGAPAAFAAGDHGGHGGHDMPADHDALEAKLADTSAFGEKGDPAKASRTITLTATEMQFNVDVLDVKAGETVTIEYSNKGAKVHELTLGDEAYQNAAREMMAMMAKMGMDPASPEHAAMHADVGNTLIVKPGETKSLTWTFSKPVEVIYACNFVGHAEAGMVGSIHVK